MRDLTSFLFPGQGSQKVGMGQNLFNSFKEARLVFEEVDEILGRSLSTIMFEGDNKELTLTENAQLALMTSSIAACRIIEKETGKSISELINYTAGHSLGEYTALCAIGSMSLADTTKVLEVRGSAMQHEAEIVTGAMVAILGTNISMALKMAQNASRITSEVCQVANNNGAGQVVLSGTKEAINYVIEEAKKLKLRAMLLNVSAPFHCYLIKQAADKIQNVLDTVQLNPPEVPIILNVSGLPTTDVAIIKDSLVKQTYSTVKWEETIFFLINQGVKNYIEVGAGKVLTKLNSRIDKNITSINFESVNNLENVITLLTRERVNV